MNDLLDKIEEKLQTQVDHVFRYYEDNELRQKMFDLGYEWYVKGLQAGIELERSKILENK